MVRQLREHPGHPLRRPLYASVLDSAEITGAFEDPNGENEYIVTLDCSVLNVPNEG